MAFRREFLALWFVDSSREIRIFEWRCFQFQLLAVVCFCSQSVLSVGYLVRLIQAGQLELVFRLFWPISSLPSGGSVQKVRI
ncbi:hypothetical protein MHO82_13145, partial [Vibrio sp. Of7-15]|uniref:hypothetical protein n=1 Tax=Vibrio sp. Of7-15 TaxID=2724879 RepID=UPI001EF2E743